MKRLLGSAIAAAVVVAGLAVTTSAEAAGGSSAPQPMRVRDKWPDRWTPKTPFYREVTRKGHSDNSTRSIDHVHELQYRLRWAGVYRGPVTGTFGDLTRKAVRRYQRQHHLNVSGIAGHRTWYLLIKDTIRARGLIPQKCKSGTGWHICYDRYRHQVTLWRNGKLRNSWLVRGGDRGYETRTGNFSVFRRDKDHVSGLYGSPMPYSQFFSGGQAFHGSSYMIDPFVDHSHGCVNMYIEDSRQLWKLTSRVRLNVHNYGRWD